MQPHARPCCHLRLFFPPPPCCPLTVQAFSPQDVVTCPACKLLCVKPETVKRAEAQEAAAEAHEAAAAASGGEVPPSQGKPAAEAFKVECPHCEEQYCHRCLAFWFDHDGYTCEEWEDARDRGADRQTERELRRGHKSCPNCGTLFVHYRGHACHHIVRGGGALLGVGYVVGGERC